MSNGDPQIVVNSSGEWWLMMVNSSGSCEIILVDWAILIPLLSRAGGSQLQCACANLEATGGEPPNCWPTAEKPRYQLR